MAETSITVEELEIKVSADIAVAMQKLESIKAKMSEVFQKSAAPIVNSMAQATTSTQRMATQSTAAYDKVNAKIKEQETLFKSLAKARFEAETKIKDTFTPAGATPKMQKQMQPMLDEKVLSDKGILQLDTQLDKVSAKLSELRAKAQSEVSPAIESIAKESRKIAPQIEKVSNATAKVAPKMEGVKRAVDKISPALKTAAANTKRLGTQMKNAVNQGILSFNHLGKVIVRAFKFLVIYKAMNAAFTFLKDGIASAINAPEIENMFRVAFGGAADEAAKFADALKDAYGIDPYVSKQMLGTFQNMTTSMGLAQNQASEMAKGMTLLANDMASLYNVDPEQASENLQSALAGQGQAVRKYGYIILDSTIKETAYRLGIAQTGAELTEQQKVLARYMTLMEQSKNAQGDLGRTLFNVANQLRILKQNISAAGRSIGEAFIPLIEAVLPPLNTFFLLLQRVGTALATFTFGMFGMNYSEWKKEQESVTSGLGDMSTADNEYADSTEKANKELKKQRGLLAGFDKLNISQRKDENADEDEDVGSGGVLVVVGSKCQKWMYPLEAVHSRRCLIRGWRS